jgi:hypothetical protein
MDAKQLLSLLMTQNFEDWYRSDLDDYITGEEEAKTTEEMLTDLEQLIDRHTR